MQSQTDSVNRRVLILGFLGLTMMGWGAAPAPNVLFILLAVMDLRQVVLLREVEP